MKKIKYPKAITVKVSEEVFKRRQELDQEALRKLIDEALKIKPCDKCGK